MKLILSSLFVFCIHTLSAQVYTAGKAMDVMKGKDISAKISVDTLAQENLFAIGPVAELRGEITVLDGEVFVSSIENKEVVNQKPNPLKAAFFVSTNVKDWKNYTVEGGIKSLKQLEKTIEKKAIEHGLSMDKAFPFLLEANFERLHTHIINKNPNEKTHSIDLHKKAKVKFEKENEEGILLGFFSKHHEGVFTHHGSYIHLHYVNPEVGENGHVDLLEHTNNFTLRLPILE